MNWTGGALQRNTTTARVTTSQKRRFARARFRPCVARRQPPSPAAFDVSNNDAKQATPTHSPHEPCHNHCHPQLTPKKKAEAFGAAHRHHHHHHHAAATGPDRLRGLKRRRLVNAKIDGAAISAVRPAEIAFTPVEELEHFGKRRKLTDMDRKRLTVGGRRPSQVSTTVRQLSPSEMRTVQGMDMRITMHLPGHYSQVQSSQSMLLESASSSEGASATEEVLAPELDLYHSSSPAPRSATPSHVTGSSPIRQEASDRSSNHSDRHSSPQPETQRRFTIDDQVLAERKGVADSIKSDHHQPSVLAERDGAVDSSYTRGPSRVPDTIRTSIRLTLPRNTSQAIPRFTAADGRSPPTSKSTWMASPNPRLPRYHGTYPCPNAGLDVMDYPAKIYGQAISPGDDFINKSTYPSKGSE